MYELLRSFQKDHPGTNVVVKLDILDNDISIEVKILDVFDETKEHYKFYKHGIVLDSKSLDNMLLELARS